MTPNPEPTLSFANARDWREWLERHHAESTGVWLQIAKRQSAEQTVTYGEALEEALCFGWIDARRGKGTDSLSLLRFCPRGPRSIWSKVNRAKALQLTEAGRMCPAGLAAIVKAKENGQWDAAYDGSRTAAIPEDLGEALQNDSKASEFFSTLSAQNRYAILFRLQRAAKPETRTRNLKKFVEMLARGETIHPQKGR